ncbi:hypothetical protein AB0J86_06910 [Micromonospora sp. NPDC049559]|uniref:hypothetical protein n=1 Tax=Micromonospora sp. NPDC049559 TaxID=3155923 RepID=UPI003414D1A3
MAGVMTISLAAFATPAQAADVQWATLYEHANGLGQTYNVFGPAPCGGNLVNIPTWFNDKTSSVRVHVPGCWIDLYEHSGGQGLRWTANYENNQPVAVPLWFNDKASSFK